MVIGLTLHLARTHNARKSGQKPRTAMRLLRQGKRKKKRKGDFDENNSDSIEVSEQLNNIKKQMKEKKDRI